MYHLLPCVNKPLRYIGNELGSIHKDWEHTPVKTVICYPDLYEIGMSYLGLRILYHLLNSRTDTLCERVFAPYSDMEAGLRNNNLPLMSLESNAPIKNFDCLGFSLQHELLYSNVLNILHLSGIPLHREDRSQADPLVIAGGLCALNPAPLSPFFDCLIIGEAEPVLPKFIELLKEKYNLSRVELLQELSKLPGLYVPGISHSAKKVAYSTLLGDNFPSQWVVPFIEITQDVLVIEIARGCTRGCRFCSPGIVARPYKERDIKSIMELITNGVKKTGYNNVSLLSLSASDHSQFIDIVKRVKKMNLNLSLPSLLGSSLTPDLAALIKKGGITLAPEAGTDRLREKINKSITEEEVLNSCELAASHKFTHIKLYYMLGLPGETEQDIDGIIDLTTRISNIMRGKQINITLSPFVPKPHTPFQWEAQEHPNQIERKIKYIKSRLRKSNIKISYPNLLAHLIEGVCARGDSKIAQVIEQAWQLGAKFDSWGDQFNFEFWERAFEKVGIDPYSYLEPRNSSLVWEMIDVGVSKEFLATEHKKATRTADCRIQGCYKCGACENPHPIPICQETAPEIIYGRSKKIKPLNKTKIKVRVKFEKAENLRFLGHLDLVRAITRAIVRTNLPIAYSEGFNKRPQIAFSPPLPFGITSKEEYFDIEFSSPPTDDIKGHLNRTLPIGIKVLEATNLWQKTPSLDENLKYCQYKIENIEVSNEQIQTFLSKTEVLCRELNIRPYILNIEREDNLLTLNMKISKVKPWWVIEYLLGIDEPQALQFKIERTKYL
ncbi:MAG: DUF2344 domain-containing protein [Candidatus Stahlbacteria bacterium]|nr:DUF2344 domain-containing protein [Candidatus Stahlbacteria bacterium]